MKIVKLPTDIDKCIKYAKVAIASYLNLQPIVTNNDFAKWKRKLEATSNVETYLWGTKETSASWNLLNCAVLVGFAKDRMLEHNIVEDVKSILEHTERLLERLDWFIAKLPQLTNSRRKRKRFADKVKNLAGSELLDTLSELTLANWLADMNFKVKFETSFTYPKKGTQKDVDLTITNSLGSRMHLEVYNPKIRFKDGSLIDLESDLAKYKDNIKRKSLTKFGSSTISDLDGKIILAINQVYIDAVHLPIAPFDSGSIEFYEEMIRQLPLNIDGILIFEDDFSRVDSFKFIIFYYLV